MTAADASTDVAAAKPVGAALRIAVIPGDGIGREVMPPCLQVLDATAARFDLDLRYQLFDWSCDRYRATGAMMPADGLAQIRNHDAIFLGAVGFPGRSRSRLAVGFADPDPPAVPTVRERAAGAP